VTTLVCDVVFYIVDEPVLSATDLTFALNVRYFRCLRV
jgi:hypothetical protein